MDITTAILCDFAQVRDRLLFISSGGVSRLYRKELPSQLGVNLALIIEVPLADAGIPQTLAIRVVNRHGAEMSHISTTFRVGDDGLFPNEIQQVPMVVSLAQTPIRSWGTHQARIFLNGELVRTVTCYVVPSTGVLSPAAEQAEEPAGADDADGDDGDKSDEQSDWAPTGAVESDDASEDDTDTDGGDGEDDNGEDDRVEDDETS